jgi:hypothetical protein
MQAKNKTVCVCRILYQKFISKGKVEKNTFWAHVRFGFYLDRIFFQNLYISSM